MKRQRKLELKKITLKNLDEPTLDAVAGALTGTCLITICIGNTCPGKATCPGVKTCVACG
jgi:hypothetical protein